MKKIFSLVAGLMLTTAATAATPDPNDYAGGDGTAATPYLIETRAQLEKLVAGTDGAGVHYRLTADIDLSGNKWTPIGNFQGVLHGGNHLLKNISISAGSVYVGLFSALGVNAYIDSLP